MLANDVMFISDIFSFFTLYLSSFLSPNIKVSYSMHTPKHTHACTSMFFLNDVYVYDVSFVCDG